MYLNLSQTDLTLTLSCFILCRHQWHAGKKFKHFPCQFTMSCHFSNFQLHALEHMLLSESHSVALPVWLFALLSLTLSLATPSLPSRSSTLCVFNSLCQGYSQTYKPSLSFFFRQHFALKSLDFVGILSFLISWKLNCCRSVRSSGVSNSILSTASRFTTSSLKNIHIT